MVHMEWQRHERAEERENTWTRLSTLLEVPQFAQSPKLCSQVGV